MIVVVGSMYLYGAYAKVPYCYAHEDPSYQYTSNQPHPDNLKFSAAAVLAGILKESFVSGRPVIGDTEATAEIDRLLKRYPQAFVIAETAQATATSAVVRKLANKPALVVSQKYTTALPPLSTIAAGNEAINDSRFVDDQGHRQIAKAMLNYIMTTHKEFFNL